MKILILDNYDSFVYNLVQYLEEISGASIDVFRNDAISLDAVDAYDLIVLSPGPGVPEEAGILLELIKRYASSKVIFGVCLGHQAIGEAFGAKLYNLPNVYHGIEHPMRLTNEVAMLFEGVPAEFTAGRYHSWSIDPATLPDELVVTAVTADDGAIMAIRHKEYDVYGVQFHPESILTKTGPLMLKNLVNHVKKKNQ